MNKLDELVKRLQEFKEKLSKAVAKKPLKATPSAPPPFDPEDHPPVIKPENIGKLIKEDMEKQVNEQPGTQPNQAGGSPMAMSEKCEIAKNGQWSLTKADDSGESKYHLHVDGQRVTNKPLTLRQVHEKWGGPKQVEKIPGHILVPHKESIAAPKIKKP